MGSSCFAWFWLKMVKTGRSDLSFFARNVPQICLGVPPTGWCRMRRNYIFHLRLWKSWLLLKNMKACKWSARIRLLSKSPDRSKHTGHVNLIHRSRGSVWYQVFTFSWILRGAIAGERNRVIQRHQAYRLASITLNPFWCHREYSSRVIFGACSWGDFVTRATRPTPCSLRSQAFVLSWKISTWIRHRMVCYAAPE